MKKKNAWVSLIRMTEQIRSRAALYDNNSKIMTVAQVNLLAVVYEHRETGILMKELARKLNVTPGSASQSVEALVEMGMLEREVGQRDRRTISVTLTMRGLEVCENAFERFNFILDETLSEFNAAERETLARVLKELSKKMTKVHSPGDASRLESSSMETAQ